MNPPTSLGWGIIGIGNIARSTIAPAIVAEANCRLVAVVSRDQSRADAVAGEFGARVATTDYAAMLADPEVDAVFIATPNGRHAEEVIAAALAGKHVLCDKPLAIDLAAAAAAVQACTDAGVFLGINFHNRYMPWVRDTRRLIADGMIGEVTVIHAEVGSGTRNYTNWRADPAMAGMGSVYNVGVHALDFVGWMLGSDPVEVTAMFDAQPSSGAVEMLALILVRYDNGTLASFDCNETVRYPQNDIAVHGTRGRIVGQNLTRSRVDGTLEVVTSQGEAITSYPAPEAHRLCLAGFTSAVLSGLTPEPSGLDGLASMALCDAIARSVTERRLVSVRQNGSAAGEGKWATDG